MAQVVLESWMQQLIHQGALAAATHPGDRHKPAQGDLHIQMLEVVAVAIHQGELAAAGVAALSRRRNRAATTQVSPREGVFSGHQISQAALTNDVAAMNAGPRADINNVIRSSDRVLVVFNDDQGVAEVPQLDEG